MRELADLLFSMVGLHNENGFLVFHHRRAVLLIRAVVETTNNAVTLTDIGKACTNYEGEKQLLAGGATALKEWLSRGALHLNLVKGTNWDEKMRWAPKMSTPPRM